MQQKARQNHPGKKKTMSHPGRECSTSLFANLAASLVMNGSKHNLCR